MSEQVFIITASEMERLHGAGPLAGFTYLHLRHWMDYESATVGRKRPISLAMLAAYTETHTPRGAGMQILQASEKNIRTALDRLQRTGLLRRLGGERLAFSLPLAVRASARPNQTRHVAGTADHGGAGTDVPSRIKDATVETGTIPAPSTAPNPAHIRNHVNLSSSTCAVIDFLKGQDIRTSGKESVIAEWVAAGLGIDQVRDAVLSARANREAEGSSQPINIGLLAAILRSPTKPKRKLTGLSDDELLRLGTSQGMPPHLGESWTDYRRRLQTALTMARRQPDGREAGR